MNNFIHLLSGRTFNGNKKSSYKNAKTQENKKGFLKFIAHIAC